MNEPTATDQEQRVEATNMRLLVDPSTHKHIRKMGAEWDCSYQAAAERILREDAERATAAETAQQQTSAA